MVLEGDPLVLQIFFWWQLANIALIISHSPMKQTPPRVSILHMKYKFKFKSDPGILGVGTINQDSQIIAYLVILESDLACLEKWPLFRSLGWVPYFSGCPSVCFKVTISLNQKMSLSYLCSQCLAFPIAFQYYSTTHFRMCPHVCPAMVIILQY